MDLRLRAERRCPVDAVLSVECNWPAGAIVATQVECRVGDSDSGYRLYELLPTDSLYQDFGTCAAVDSSSWKLVGDEIAPVTLASFELSSTGQGRLKLFVRDLSSDLKVPMQGWWDSDLGHHCGAKSAADGTLRCMGGDVFADVLFTTAARAPPRARTKADRRPCPGLNAVWSSDRSRSRWPRDARRVRPRRASKNPARRSTRSTRRSCGGSRWSHRRT